MNQETLVNSRLRPGFCLIRPIDQEFSSVLVKPDKVDVRQGYGRVLNVASPMPKPGFEEGDYVIYDRVRGAEIETKEEDLSYVKIEHVLCVVE